MPASAERRARAVSLLAGDRLRAPAAAANAARNARAERGRRQRWQPARAAVWDLLEPRLREGARVAIAGAGNGDDLPLRRLAERCSLLALIDLDPRAARGARRRVPRRLRRRIEVIEHDLTGGAADAIARAAARGRVPEPPLVPEAPLPGAPYDLAVGDLLYSQLLYPALLDLGVEARRRDAFLGHYGPSLTRGAVARLHASAPLVAHLHDPLAWWQGHAQPLALAQILAVAAERGPEAALALTARGAGPAEFDPRTALRSLGIQPGPTALWRWPFAPEVDYLACATLAQG